MNTKIISVFIIGCYLMSIIPSTICNFNRRYDLSRTRRIVKGQRAELGTFQYQVYLSTYKNGLRYQCGGAILSEYHVITAAQCVTYVSNGQEVPTEAIIIKGGSVNLNSESLQTFKVNKIIVHERFNPINFDYDIAILVLTTPFHLNITGFKAIELTQNPITSSDTECLVSGWGQQNEDENQPILDLYYAAIYLTNRTLCETEYSKFEIRPSMLCFGTKRLGSPQNFCHGDNGGPLVCENKLVGTVSWSIGCARANQPGIFANIDLLRPWILKVLKDNPKK